VVRNGDGRDDLPQLLEAAREGCGESLGSAFEACRQYLLLVANQELAPELRPKAGASDLVQDTLLEAQRDFGRFQGSTRRELTAWLRDVLLNNLRDFRKSFLQTGKRQLSREFALHGACADWDWAGTLATSDPSPSALMVRAEEREIVERALSEIPEDYREVIRWRHEQGSSFEQIGRQMGRSSGAAKQLWCRAIKALSRKLSASHER